MENTNIYIQVEEYCVRKMLNSYLHHAKSKTSLLPSIQHPILPTSRLLQPHSHCSNSNCIQITFTSIDSDVHIERWKNKNKRKICAEYIHNHPHPLMASFNNICIDG